MAITVSDIHEKVFTEVTGEAGYSIEEVDDFLDAIADQMAAITRENLALSEQVSRLETQLAETSAKVPDYNENDYFQNLQNAMRETLIGAQRIADDTIEDANQRSAKMVSDAQAKADHITSEATATATAAVETARAEAERITTKNKEEMAVLEDRFAALKAAAKSYKADFSKLLEQQGALLRDNADLF